MEIKFKKLEPAAVTPTYAYNGDACMDLTSIGIDEVEDEGIKYVVHRFGLSFEIPDNFVMLIFPRSSISRTNLILSNSVGVIDSGYRGEVSVRFKYTVDVDGAPYKVGDKVAQFLIVPYPKLELKEVEQLSNTERGIGGFGSSNSK